MNQDATSDKKKYVEILANGDILFAGKLISSSEFAVGNVLCGLRRGLNDLEGDSSKYTDYENISDMSDDGGKLNKSSKNPAKRRKPSSPTFDLPADDVRLTYTKKYFDSLNSGDAEIIAQTLREIAIPKTVLVNKLTNQNPEHQLPSHLEVVGIDAIASTCESFFLATPDAAATMLSEKIIQFANGESTIECSVEMKGTKMYELNGLPEKSVDKVILSSAPEDTPDNTNNMANNHHTRVVVNVEGDDKSNAKQFKVGAFNQKKNEFLFTTQLTFHLNVNKKVFLIVNAKD